MNAIQQKAADATEIVHAISVCNQIQNTMRLHLNGNLPLSEKNIDELVTNFNAGGLSVAIKHLSDFATDQLEWLENNSGDA